MTDQYQWQDALAAAERAIPEGQIEEAANSLRIALIHIGTLQPTDPARIPILGTFIRCCERAIERSAEQSLLAMKHRAAEVRRIMALASEHAPLTFRQAAAQLPDELAAFRRQSKLSGRLRNSQTSAHYMFLDSQIAQLGEDSAGVVETLLTLEQLEWVHPGHEDDAFALLQRALAIRERTLSSEHPDTLNVVGRLALRYDTYTSYKQAIPLWQRLLSHVEQTGPVGRFGLVELLALLGKAYYGVRLYAEAKKVWKRYLNLTEGEPQQTDNRLSPMEMRRLNIYHSIGYACLAQEEWAEAASFLALAIESYRTMRGFTVRIEDGPSGINLSSGIAAYAKALSHSDRQVEAIPLFEEAITLDSGSDRKRVGLLRNYAAALRASGDIAKAMDTERAASALLNNIEAER